MITLAASDTIYGAAGSANAITYSVFGMQLSAGTPSWSKLAQGQLSNSAAIIYASPTGTTSLISAIILYNTTGSVVNAQIFSGGSATSNQLFNINLQAYGQVFFDQSGLQTYDGSGNTLMQTPTIMSPNTPLATVAATAGSVGLDVGAARRDHTHYSYGGTASVTAVPSVNIGPSSVVIGVIPPNTLQVGTVWRLQATGLFYSAGTVGSPSAYITIGSNGVSGNGQCPNYNGSSIAPYDAYVNSAITIPGASGTTPFSLRMLVTMFTASGGLLQPVLASFIKDNLGTIWANAPIACTQSPSGRGKVDPTIANYVTYTGMQYYSQAYGFLPVTGTLEVVKP